MKKNTLILALTAVTITLTTLTMSAFWNSKKKSAEADSEGHVLVALWADYQQAVSLDRPVKQLEILSKIKSEASEKRLAWDYYDAAKKYVSDAASRNWKLQDSLKLKLGEAIAKFDEPVMSFVWKLSKGDETAEAVFEYVRANAKRLEASCNQPFWTSYDGSSSVPGITGSGFVKEFYANDYQYALWTLLAKNCYTGKLFADIAEALAEYQGDSYPLGAFLEYVKLEKSWSDADGKTSVKKSGLEAFAGKYAGKAVLMFAKAALLEMEFSSLGEKKAGSDEYKALYDKCAAFEKERTAFTGIESKVVGDLTTVENLCNHLTDKSVEVRLEDGKILVLLQNLKSAKLSMSPDEAGSKMVLSESLDNPQCSFYVKDTVSVDLPVVDDGDYVIVAKNGKCVSSRRYSSHRISVASRTDSRGKCIYAAGWKSGKPLESADLQLYKNGKVIASCADFKFDGFTPLPQEFVSVMKDNVYYTLTCSYKGEDGLLRKSEQLSLNSWYNTVDSGDDSKARLCGEVFTDKSAYNPGETLEFKVLLYNMEGRNNARVAPQGTECKVVLKDAQDNEVSSQLLTTNEFGSLAGKFALPKDLRNGYWYVNVLTGGKKLLTVKPVRVDEFVLPTFDLEFDKTETLFFPGDEVTVSGRVRSLSGHPVSSANAVYEVTSYGDKIDSGKLKMSSDGSFVVSFKALSSQWSRYYNVEVRISDDTGETHEYSRAIWVADDLSLSLELENGTEGQAFATDEKSEITPRRWRRRESVSILRGNVASVKMDILSDDGEAVPVKVKYTLLNEHGTALLSGEAASGVAENIDLKSCPSGLYTIKADAQARSQSGKEYTDSSSLRILLVNDSMTVLDAPVKDFIMPLAQQVTEGENASIWFGMADDAPVWAIAEIFGEKANVLDIKFVQLSGVRGKDGSLVKMEFPYKKEYPDAVLAKVFYFRNGDSVSYSYEFHKVRKSDILPLEFSAFEDRTLPDTEYTFSVKTAPETECLAAVFDKSSELIEPNHWPVYSPVEYNVCTISCNTAPGSVDADGRDEVIAYGSARKSKSQVFYSKNARASAEMECLEDAAPVMESKSLVCESGAEPAVRDNFASTLTFQPFLRPDKNGKLSFSFRTGGTLSTFIVSLYAHDRSMRNSALRREMTVSLPVKVNVVAPEYLYCSDNYRLAVGLSSVAENDVEGTLTLNIYKGGGYKALESSGAKPVSVQSLRVKVPAGESLRSLFDVNVNELIPECGTLGFKVVFKAENGGNSFSDAMFVPVFVYPDTQCLTEAHSAVLLAGADQDALISRLRKMFVNADGDNAEVKMLSILDMVRDAVPSKVEPAGNDVLTLSEALYVRRLADVLRAAGRMPARDSVVLSDEELMKKMLACHNADGGFGWFEGMSSSPVITAVLLERCAKMLKAGLLDGSEAVAGDAASAKNVEEVLASAVKYIDKRQFAYLQPVPFWCGGLSDSQYMYVRSMYASVEFTEWNSVSGILGKLFGKRAKQFRSDAKAYLVPSKERGLNGRILDKARRLSTLIRLSSSSDGIALAKSWGVRVNAGARLEKSVEADVASLLEYAVMHKDGGMYYPNAVMPFRGLLESEAYAHSMLCDLLSGYAFRMQSSGKSSVNASEAKRVADGIRLWLMLQKETQHWEATPDFVDAINSVMEGDAAVKSTKVVVLTAVTDLPFAEVKASGNGFTVERKFYRVGAGAEVSGGVSGDASGDVAGGVSDSGPYASGCVAGSEASGRFGVASDKAGRQEIRPGDRVNVGDKIVAEYVIHNDENRSFVKISAPREAAFRPANQFSGRYGWWLSPLRIADWYSFTPQGYRNVKSALTEYYFDSYPEENTVISEEFFVTQTGTFSAPVVTVESLYAPHYRANAPSLPPLISR